MAEKQMIMAAYRVAGGDWIRFTREKDKPFSYYLSGRSRESKGQSELLAGEQVASVLMFPGEQIRLMEEVQE